MTEQQLFLLEHEIQNWHAQRTRPATPYQHATPTALVEHLRRVWSRWTTSAEQSRAITAVQLEVLRAVARGEISPETAQRVLSAR